MIDLIEALSRDAIDASADRAGVFRLRSGIELNFTGRSLLLTFSVPQFFFHLTMIYDICAMLASILPKRFSWAGVEFQARRGSAPPCEDTPARGATSWLMDLCSGSFSSGSADGEDQSPPVEVASTHHWQLKTA